jgi:hypothetical protein
MPDSLAPAHCRTAALTDKKEFGVDVGDALAYDFADTIAVTPPLFRIIIRVGNCYDTHRHVSAECLLIEKARSPGVGAFRQNVDTRHGRFVLAKPISERDRRTVGSLSTIHERRRHLNRFARNSSLFSRSASTLAEVLKSLIYPPP